jgi:hypothetical protein
MESYNHQNEQAPPQSYQSQGEKQLASFLDWHKIPFLYEHPLAIIDRGKTRLWYPDFHLPTMGVLIEYGGRLSDADYAQAWQRKKQVYLENRLSPVMLTASDMSGNWPRDLARRIESVLAERLADLREKVRRLVRDSR